MLENKSLLLVETTVDRVAVDEQLKKNEILQTIFTYHSDIRKVFRKGARGVTEFVPLIGLFLHAFLFLEIARPVTQLKWSEGITTYL